jgi:hypothetical protein
MPKPNRSTLTESFDSIKAKKIKVGDRITLGFRTTIVTENKKNSYGDRVLTLRSFANSPRENLTLCVPSNFGIRITRSNTVTDK